MCYMNCVYEDFEGECRKPPYKLCPLAFETSEEYITAKEELEKAQDEPLVRYVKSFPGDLT